MLFQFPVNKELLGFLVRKYKADPNRVDSNGDTALTMNVDDPEVIELLIQHGGAINYQIPDTGDTALHCAAENGNVNVIEILLANGANKNLQNNVGETALYLAVYTGSSGSVEKLLQHNADPNIAADNGHTVLTITGSPIIINLLIQHGAAIDYQIPDSGDTALHCAAEAGDVDSLETLLTSGANKNLPNAYGETPLYVAVDNSHIESIKILLQHNADSNIPAGNGHTALTITNSPEVVKLLIQNGAAIDYQIPDTGDTALHCAVEAGDINTMQALLNEGANKNMQNAKGETPLFLAVKNEQLESILMLLVCEVDVNIAAANGHTALTITNSFQVTKALIQIGARVDYQMPETGDSVLHFAAENGQEEKISTLLMYVGDVNIKNAQGETPLFKAVENGYKGIVELLLKKGADPNLPDHKGRSPLSLSKDSSIRKLLIEYGALTNSEEGYCTLM